MQTGTPDPPVVPRKTANPESSIHYRIPKLRSRHPIQAGVEARGIETSLRGGEVYMGVGQA